MNILIVDDKEENLYLLEALLKGNGHHVEQSSNGAEAIERLKSGVIELIISDILMPVMDGFELCRKVKADETLRNIPIIIYTATYTGPQDEAFALKIGADRFIIKPCEPEVLMEAVHNVTASKSPDKAPEALPEEEVLKLYNERLVRKIEQKMLQLEKEVQVRKKTEDILQQSEKKYRTLFNSIRDAILVSGTDRTIIDFNTAFVELFGYSLEEIAGKKTLLLYEYEEGYRALGAALKDHLDDADFLTTVNFRKKDGTIFTGEITVLRLHDDEGGLTGHIGIIRDITERRQAEKKQKDLEAQYLQAQKMESVGRLAGGVAHDYNNMLSVILGYTELAMNRVEPYDPLYNDLAEILKAAKRSTEITRQLLAFSRKQPISPRVLDLNETVESMLKMLRRLIGEEVDLAWLPKRNLWPVKIDASQIEQVLANLCVNARDAISGIGKITIETNMVKFDKVYCAYHAGFIPGEFVMLAISDDGCGMTREILANIFEPFFTTKDVNQGTGLGLATVYGIVKQNNGFINVYSEPEEGTTFKIYLPRFLGEIEGRDKEKIIQIPAGQGEMLLLVEDEPAIRNIGQLMLERLGYRVLVAGTPAEALDIAMKHEGTIRLLITDVVMPGMNGRLLAEKMRSLQPDIKTLFMSGYTSNVIVHRGVLDEDVHFIQKPFSIQSLGEKVREILDSK